MPDYRNNEARIVAAKLIQTMISNATQEKPVTGAALRIAAATNYGISATFVNQYVKDLAATNQANIERIDDQNYYAWRKEE
jgi:hypothetical protein